MNKPTVDDYITQGIYGQKEINPAERKRFLGTLRERIVVALTKSQVREQGTYEEVEELMDKNKEAKLFLNGQLDFKYLRDYIQLANKYDIQFLVVSNKEAETDIGLVLAYDYAVDREHIFIKKETMTEEDVQEDRKGFFSFFQRLFRP